MSRCLLFQINMGNLQIVLGSEISKCATDFRSPISEKALSLPLNPASEGCSSPTQQTSQPSLPKPSARRKRSVRTSSSRDQANVKRKTSNISSGGLKRETQRRASFERPTKAQSTSRKVQEKSAKENETSGEDQVGKQLDKRSTTSESRAVDEVLQKAQQEREEKTNVNLKATSHDLTPSHFMKNHAFVYSCRECKGPFRSRANMLRHVSHIHFKCEIASAYRNGIQDGKEEGIVLGSACRLCRKTFTRRSYLLSHLASYHNLLTKEMFESFTVKKLGGKTKECPICSKGFTETNSMLTHVCTRHFASQIMEKYKEIGELICGSGWDTSSWACVICNQRFGSNHRLMGHLGVIHGFLKDCGFDLDNVA